MSTISKEEVIHIAKLARLELTEPEIEKMQKDLSAILDYFNLLKKAPQVKKDDFQAQGIIARQDEVLPRKDGISEKLIAAAPENKDGYIKVKTIL
jgi:aspartyl-tRNA(Asn)/glutamyl-tRNA(Gln) amidotransferase subunit C